jgi:antitoxin ParD1/3/4
MGIHVTLTPQLEELVRERVSSGRYASANEVVRDALHLLRDQDHLREAKLNELKADIRNGLESGPSAAWSASDIKAKARARPSTKAV